MNLICHVNKDFSIAMLDLERSHDYLGKMVRLNYVTQLEIVCETGELPVSWWY